jgi:TubC N-terminal docking domain
MTAATAIEQAKALGVRLELADGGQLAVEWEDGELPTDLIQALREHKVEIIASLAMQQSPAPAPSPLVGAQATPSPIPAELEALLGSIAADVSRLTNDPSLREGAGHLLDDCRDIARQGKLATAVALAQQLSRSMPEYFGAGKPPNPPRRAAPVGP